MHGQSVRKRGVDCVRFVCAVLSDLRREPMPAIPRLPLDASMHNPRGARATMRLIRRLYMPNRVVVEPFVEPGDFLVFARAGGGPGHAMIVGPEENTIWHSDIGAGVCKTGIGAILGDPRHHLVRVYRATNRDRWI